MLWCNLHSVPIESLNIDCHFPPSSSISGSLRSFYYQRVHPLAFQTKGVWLNIILINKNGCLWYQHLPITFW